VPAHKENMMIMMLLWLLVPTLCMAGAIFGWLLLMENIMTPGGSGMLFAMMHYASLPVALLAIWIGLRAMEYFACRFTRVG
jgi:hypothetical protein